MLFGGGSVQAQDKATSGGGGGRIVVGGEPYGRAPYPLTSQGARLGVSLSETRALTLTYVKSRHAILLSDFQFEEYQLRLDQKLGSIGVFGVGLGVRDVELNYDVFVEEEATAQSISERRQALIVGGHFGVEFELTDWLVFGSDLYSVTVPVRWLKGEDEYPAAAQAFEDDPKTYPYIKSGYGVCLQLARTYVALRW